VAATWLVTHPDKQDYSKYYIGIYQLKSIILIHVQNNSRKKIEFLFEKPEIAQQTKFYIQ
jgi:hypothetical protein